MPNFNEHANFSGSPFVVAGRLEDPAHFVGRVRERSTLIERSYNGFSTSLVGSRRLGKTWLMDYLRLVAPHELGSRHHVVYIDASLDSCRTISGFVGACLVALQVALPANPSELRLSHLEEAVRSLQARNHLLVLCVDEFERFGQSNRDTFDLEFFEGLRAIAGLGAALVTSSKLPLNQLVSQIGATSPFFNIFELVRLRRFTVREVDKFIASKSTLAAFNEFERAKLRELGLDEPLRLQLVGSMLYRDKQLALREDEPDLYRPNDVFYWEAFQRRLDEKYGSMT